MIPDLRAVFKLFHFIQCGEGSNWGIHFMGPLMVFKVSQAIVFFIVLSFPNALLKDERIP